MQPQAQQTHLHHLQVLAGKELYDRLGKDAQSHSHDQGPEGGGPGGEAVAAVYPVVAFGTPVEACHRLEAGAEAQNDIEGEHHHLVAHADAGHDGVGDAAGHIVEQDAGEHCQTVAQHGRGAYGHNFLHSVQLRLKVSDGQMEQAAAGDVGEHQNAEADDLADGGGQRSSGNAHIQTKDEQRVQQAVEDAAEAHAHHAQSGTALGAQALVHDKIGGHKGRGAQDIGGVVDGVPLTGGGGTQQAHHGGHKDGAEDEQQRTQAHGQEESGGQHLAGLLVPAFSQKAGDVAVGTHRQHTAAHHDQLVQRGVDGDGGGGGVPQGADKVGVGQGIDGIDEEGNDGGDCHLEDKTWDWLVEEHISALLLVLLRPHGRASFTECFSYCIIFCQIIKRATEIPSNSHCVRMEKRGKLSVRGVENL